MARVNNRDIILKEGLKVFLNKGYDAASVQDIMHAARLPKGSFYNYFKSKENFALEVLDFYLQISKEKYFAKMKAIPPKEQLQAYFLGRLELARKHKYKYECYSSVLNHAIGNHSKLFRKAVLAAFDKINEPLVDALNHLQQAGTIDAGTDLLALAQFLDASWRGAMMRAKLEISDRPLRVFIKELNKNYLHPNAGLKT